MKIADLKAVTLSGRWEGPYHGAVSIDDKVIQEFFILRHPGFWTAEIADNEDDNDSIWCRSRITLHQENHARLLKEHGIQCINEEGRVHILLSEQEKTNPQVLVDKLQKIDGILK